MAALKEQWRPVVGYEDSYEVSDLGRVRTLEHKHITRNRWGTMERTVPSRILDPKYGKYLRVTLHGKRKFVHVLVAEAFLPNPYCLEEVNHIDEDKHNNTLSNLEWIDRAGNAIHSMGREFSVVCPDGSFVRRKGIALFCREHGLKRNRFLKLINGQMEEYNGYKCS